MWRFFRVLAAFAGLLWLLPAGAADRPNIVWLSAEDIGPHLGCYGDAEARTPRLDRLAAEGTRFARAYTTAGVCAPSRSAIITGMYQTSLGTQHMRGKASLPVHIGPFTVALRAAGYYCTNNSKTDYQFDAPAGTWDESSNRAHWKNRPEPDQPFFAVFNYTGCHESGIENEEKYRSVTEGIAPIDRAAAAKTLPPYYPDTPVTREDWGRYYDVIAALDRWAGEHLAGLEEAGLADDTIVIFWSDHGAGLPRAKRWLYESGTRVPLIVRIPERFRAAGQGAPGSVDERLVSLMDLGPTALRLAGLDAPGHVQGQAFLGAGIPAPRAYIHGARDRMDERYDIIRMVRDAKYRYIRNYEPFKPYYQYMNTPEKGATMREIRRAQAEGDAAPAVALFLADRKPFEELYDVENDPHELRNLAEDPAHREALERLRRAHLDWVAETRDTGLIPEPLLVAEAEAAGSAWAVLNGPDGAARMERIRDAASLALAGAGARERLVGLLADPDPAVRYWAATGLGNLGAAAAGAGAALRPILEDPAPVVRVAAARAFARMGEPEAALPVLVAVVDGGAQWERLHAAIVLDEMEEDALPALDAMRRNKAYREEMVAQGKYTVRVLNRALNELLGTNETVD
ncbi:MAG: sulfatase [Candidatus Hydrogenedentes bacterium]|nr:sulfatase [Candidatus Hydrogenedentota bacterium]